LFGHGGNHVFYGGSYVVNRDSSKVDLHEGNELDASRMHFMYDRAYGDIVLGQVKGLTPFYRLLNTLFCFTLTPRGGDSDNISHRAKNLLVQMAPGSASLLLWSLFGMRLSLVHRILLVPVTMLRIYSI
jgi:hypothetical protein